MSHPFNRPHDLANAQPRRILILDGGHTGDIVLATGFLPVLRCAFPQAQVGFAVGTWSRSVLEGHPDISYLHSIDHWAPNRGSSSFFAKARRYRRSRNAALQEMRSVGYDLAICIRPFFPDLLDVAWVAGIPQRIAFAESLWAPLATHLKSRPVLRFLHQTQIQASLLSEVGVATECLQMSRPNLPESTSVSKHEVAALLGTERLEQCRYRVIHMGSGANNRELPPSFWHEVAMRLSKECTVLFTGKGEREAGNIQAALQGLPNCIDASNKLSWSGFVAAVRFAEKLYGVESMAGHVAAAVGTPSVTAYTGVAGVARWRPSSPLAVVWTKHLECAPCDEIHGCAEMTCVRGISASDLLLPLNDTLS